MKVCFRIAAIPREVKRLAAIAEKRAAEAGSIRASDRFRRLTEAETEALVGANLLAAIGGGHRRA